MYAHFEDREDFYSFRDSLWALWYPTRCAGLVAGFSERGHYIGGPLDYAPPRATRDRSHLRYGPAHPRAGEPMDPKPGRTGGLVWVTTAVPGCKLRRLIRHVDGGDGGLLIVEQSLQEILGYFNGATAMVPESAALKAEADLAAMPDPREGTTRQERRDRDVARQLVDVKRCRLVLGHEIEGTQLAMTRSSLVDPSAVVAREALPRRSRETLDALEAER